ncbi:hypothetical protein [Vitiosangium sp. GDMCC 1.1324]|uniref:hypothetical protein n=1 Tax=Vitiosangium sp. (strain GDMCC 1.1324) TaxID=2138576 RepID=UPI000D33645E|nr:hypothetical protein [Vitiosangium sp. GDMCC 1.1324]PTL80309.1 hypothetical protein DAT35_30460 [Vitiosangium sp. GDMCC 1.1324]
MSYPPSIGYSDFKIASPPSRDLSADECVRSRKCSIVDLWLHPHPKSAPFTAEHGELAANAAGRYRFAPGAANTDVIHFSFSNVSAIRSATLALYERTTEPTLPLWSRDLALEGDEGTLPLNELLKGGDGWPNVCRAPYRLELSITPADDADATVSCAWIYLDVVVKRLALHLAKDITVSAKEKAVLETIDETVLGNPDKLARVLLPGNVFAQTRDEFRGVANGESMVWHGADCSFERHAAMWDQGPTLPLTAELLIEDSKGEAISSPEGTRGTPLLWDVADAGQDAPDELEGVSDAQVIRTYLQHYKSFKPTTPAGINCHVDFGGKRGSDQRLLLAAVPRSGENPGHYDVSYPETRHWAAFSKVLASGKAGVYFQPSRMAGDAYKLAVHFHYSPDGDGARRMDTAEAIESTSKGQTGILQIWKQIDIVERLQLAPEEEALQLKLNGFRDERAQFVEDMEDPELTEAWNALATQDAKDKYKGTRFCEIYPSVTDVSKVKNQLLNLRATWATELTAIRSRLNRAFIHVNTQEERASAELDGYHDTILQLAEQSPIIRLAIADTETWRNGKHALEFITPQAFWENIQEKKGGLDAALLWAEQYFGPTSDAADGQACSKGDSLLKSSELDKKFFDDLYKESCRSWAKRLLAQFAERTLTGAAGIYVFSFSALYKMDEDEEGPMAYAQPLSGLDGSKLLYVVFARSDETTAAHEIGHGLFLCHAPGGIVRDPDPHAHDANMSNCLMGYHENATDFCGFCQLRLRGWDRALLHPRN